MRAELFADAAGAEQVVQVGDSEGLLQHPQRSRPRQEMDSLGSQRAALGLDFNYIKVKESVLHHLFP